MQLATFPLATRGPNPNPNAPGFQYGWRITSYFGGRIDPITGRPGTHGGEDLGAPTGVAMVAVLPGIVTQGWDPSGGGNWSGLLCDNGAYFGYGHAQSFANGGRTRRVAAGEVIAWVDSTGASTGAHLHFAYRPPGSSVYADPYDLLQEVAIRIVGGGPATSPPAVPDPGDADDMFSDTDRQTLAQIKSDVEVAGGLGVGDVLATWENDTRSVIVNGVEMITAQSDAVLTDKVIQAGWASRPYPFCYRGHPAVFMWADTGDGRGLGREWIKDQAELADLVQTRLNPAVIVFPFERKAVHDSRFPMIGELPPEGA
jgi:hypothetical protein